MQQHLLFISSLALLLLLLPLPDAASAAAGRPGPRRLQRASSIATSANTTSSNGSNNNNNSLHTMLTAGSAEATTAQTAAKLKTTAAAAAAANAGSKYEIRGVAGEPHYKSVNLTWEVEFVPPADNNDDGNGGSDDDKDVNGVTNMSGDVEPPKAFQIFYCEMQNFGPQRCRVKLVNGSIVEQSMEPSVQQAGAQVQHFAALVDNLRMATKYSFHIRPAVQRRNGLRMNSGRAELFNENEIESEVRHGHMAGQSIVIPTKGFSAQATQCLPQASEIEVETGPYFGGRIVVDGGSCGIKGDANDARDVYTMRIDHKLCGSVVKPETNTVETFITVQENLGIFTHSTRRFVVVCSYQSGMQTVRASFTVPGKHGVAAAYEPNDPFEADEQRLGREMRHMRFVNKSELVLREEASAELPAVVVEQPQQPLFKAEQAALNSSRQPGRALSLAVAPLPAADAPAQTHTVTELSTKYAKLVVEQPWSAAAANMAQHALPAAAAAAAQDEDARAYASTLHYISSNLGSVLVTVSISVIIICICIIVVHRSMASHRQMQRQRLRLKSNMVVAAASAAPSPSTHFPHKTLPRALQQQQYQCTL